MTHKTYSDGLKRGLEMAAENLEARIGSVDKENQTWESAIAVIRMAVGDQHVFDALISAARGGPESNLGWMPIETAPEGDDVIVAEKDTFGKYRVLVMARESSGRWWRGDTPCNAPDLWQPLPPPPSV